MSSICLRMAVTAACQMGMAICSPASAQFSARDGYAPDGSYKLQFEVTPYLWLPATSASYSIGLRGGTSGSGGTGIPSAAELRDSLHGAFMGFGLVRYGPWSGEIDIEWVSASQGKQLTTSRLGVPVNLSLSASYVRVAPGIGYQVISTEVAGMPMTVDARVGFAWLSWNAKIGSERDLLGSASDNGSFVQPWLGTRLSIYPARDWRVDIAALAQGFGAGNGSWGWGASAIASYAATDWLTVSGGFRALNSSRNDDNAGITGTGKRSLNFTAYGPILGVGFRF